MVITAELHRGASTGVLVLQKNRVPLGCFSIPFRNNRSVLKLKAPRHQVHHRFEMHREGTQEQMILAPHIHHAVVRHRLSAPRKADLFRAIGRELMAAGHCNNPAEIVAAIEEREQRQNTALREGIAISAPTIEGLSPQGELGAIPRAMKSNYAFQCGFCTPGFLMSTAALLDENSAPSEEEIRDSLHGNICRCTGYLSIIDGVKDAAKRITEGDN